MSVKEILSSRPTKETAGFEKRQRRRDEEEDLKWRERRGRTLSVAFDSMDLESGRGPSHLEPDLDLGAQFELPGLTHPCEVSSHRETLTGLTQAFVVPGDQVKLPTCPEYDLAGYTETQVKPFTVADTVDEKTEAAYNCAKGKGKGKQKPKTLSKSAVKWVYLQIWLYFYGFRCNLCSY